MEYKQKVPALWSLYFTDPALNEDAEACEWLRKAESVIDERAGEELMKAAVDAAVFGAGRYRVKG